MKRAIVLLANGFEEIETVTAIDVLRRAGIEVVVAALGDMTPVGSRGVRVGADVDIDAVLGERFDLVYLPGGGEGARRLAADPRVGDLLRRQRREGGLVAAICAAPIALRAHGVLPPGARLTSHPGVASDFRAFDYVEEEVVDDGAIVTSRGAGTALPFALHLVGRLAGRGARDEVARAMVVAAR